MHAPASIAETFTPMYDLGDDDDDDVADDNYTVLWLSLYVPIPPAALPRCLPRALSQAIATAIAVAIATPDHSETLESGVWRRNEGRVMAGNNFLDGIEIVMLMVMVMMAMVPIHIPTMSRYISEVSGVWKAELLFSRFIDM
ncbi:hypothetical protein BZA77DRAFT_298323 [Pyronema omphalodes]|nr:hypothetical protein BZA77DRAFT_298323 [Pyronema omphalodes]